MTRTEYDKVWQPVKVTAPEGGETCYTYDHLKRLTVATDHTGRTVRFAYNPNGNLIQIRYPDDSHNPIGDQRSLGQEFQYLLENNYEWNPLTMTMSPK